MVLYVGLRELPQSLSEEIDLVLTHHVWHDPDSNMMRNPTYNVPILFIHIFLKRITSFLHIFCDFRRMIKIQPPPFGRSTFLYISLIQLIFNLDLFIIIYSIIQATVEYLSRVFSRLLSLKSAIEMSFKLNICDENILERSTKNNMSAFIVYFG
jgi:hypothetical protein